MSFGFIFFAFLAAGAGETKSLKYPQIISFHGGVKVQSGREPKLRTPKPKEVLHESATLESGDGEVMLALDSGRSLTLLPNTRIEIPNISWETGETGDILLKYGDLIWRADKPSVPAIKIKSELFEIPLGQGIYKFVYDEEKTWARGEAYEGNLDFSASNAENSVLLTPGHRVTFQGVKEDGEVAYDVLLKGRKIPKGRLLEIETLSDSDKKKIFDESLAQKIKNEEARVRTEKAHYAENHPDQICKNPHGRLNECVWTCQKNPKTEKLHCRTERAGVSCFRRRCNANGRWGDDFVLDADAGSAKCQARPQVGACDF